ncbi:MAG: type II toxin-antitoxin system PemK/MazF family toxin [Chloroflexi bacterium]|nr:type II toxin-antitoxin system PemK/MazF family toxin [Chloroflexota bacterium]
MTGEPIGLRRGQLHWAYLDPVIGSEQAGRRPVVIVSIDELLLGPTLVVVPLTSRVPVHMPPQYVLLPRSRTGLAQDSVALCHQVRAISTRRLVGRAGNDLNEADMAAIGYALRYVLDVEQVA